LGWRGLSWGDCRQAERHYYHAKRGGALEYRAFLTSHRRITGSCRIFPTAI
jgi:hypothetical protein